MNSPRHSHYPWEIYAWTRRNVCTRNNYLSKEWVNIRTNERVRQRWVHDLCSCWTFFSLSCTLLLIESVYIYIYTHMYRSKQSSDWTLSGRYSLVCTHVRNKYTASKRERGEKQLGWEQIQRITGGKLLD
jgi:hypothetical protein